jgi:hypothetical protein
MMKELLLTLRDLDRLVKAHGFAETRLLRA